jgi:hypothetical protein
MSPVDPTGQGEDQAMQFGVYLVENGVINTDEFYEALKLHLRSRPQLGALAIQTQKLNFRQVFAILRAQCDAPNELFGELAVSLGYLTKDDLAQLLNEQEQRSLPFMQAIAESGVLSTDLIEQHYSEYRRCMKQVERDELAAATLHA